MQVIITILTVTFSSTFKLDSQLERYISIMFSELTVKYVHIVREIHFMNLLLSLKKIIT